MINLTVKWYKKPYNRGKFIFDWGHIYIVGRGDWRASLSLPIGFGYKGMGSKSKKEQAIIAHTYMTLMIKIFFLVL